MKSVVVSLAALLVASAGVVSGCSSGDDDGSSAGRLGSTTAGGPDAGDSRASDGGAVTSLPACTYAPILAAEEDAGADSGVWPVYVSRAYLSCSVGAGVTEDCHSDVLTSCPDDGTGAGDGVDTGCVDQCAGDEYAVSYGGPPHPSPDGGFFVPADPTIPGSCRSLSGGPGGAITYCCACGGS